MIKSCDHIIAYHIGHDVIYKSEATSRILTNTCCGGVLNLTYCPICGQNIMKIVKKIMEKKEAGCGQNIMKIVKKIMEKKEAGRK